jgi:chemotaxis signal transduction protein
MLAEEKAGPYCSMNDWILEKHEEVREYIKDVIDVEDSEEKLKVNKYAQYASKDKTVIVIPLKDMCQLHQLLHENKPELTVDEKDYLAIILDEIGKVRRVPDSNIEEVQLTLNNKFPPALSKDVLKKNVKTETINEAIKVLRKIPGFSGDTFLEIFVRMKLHCKKNR